MNCCNCGENLGEIQDKDASIAILVMGDEYIYSYFRCGSCGMFACERYLDRFMGGSEAVWMPPIPGAEGEKILELIRACPRPSDKFCECDSHQKLYHGRIRG